MTVYKINANGMIIFTFHRFQYLQINSWIVIVTIHFDMHITNDARLSQRPPTVKCLCQASQQLLMTNLLAITQWVVKTNDDT